MAPKTERSLETWVGNIHSRTNFFSIFTPHFYFQRPSINQSVFRSAFFTPKFDGRGHKNILKDRGQRSLWLIIKASSFQHPASQSLRENLVPKKSRNRSQRKFGTTKSGLIYAIFSAHSAYFNVSRQKVPYFNHTVVQLGVVQLDPPI